MTTITVLKRKGDVNTGKNLPGVIEAAVEWDWVREGPCTHENGEVLYTGLLLGQNARREVLLLGDHTTGKTCAGIAGLESLLIWAVRGVALWDVGVVVAAFMNNQGGAICAKK
ncbi:Uncharacterised protein [Corynebacterium pseudotuberculosis]|nr:Uncharacterised protein [Corynebacterium pseudotuberculosis]